MIVLFLLLILGINCKTKFRTGKDGINFITVYERYISTAVEKNKDGFYCVGYNHCGKDVKFGQYVPQEKARELLKEDLIPIENYVNDPNYVTPELNQYQFDALVWFTYDFGPKTLKELCYGRTISYIGFNIDSYSNALPSAGYIQKQRNLKNLFNKMPRY